nr:hypothetical protein [bacterium]
MIKHVILWSTFALWLVGLPLAGTWLAGKPVRPYLHIPPDTIWGKYPVAHPPFSWAWFVFYAAVILLAIGPLVFRFLTWRGEPSENARKPPCRFPWWGWTGIVLLIFGWYAEWARTNWIRIDHPPAFGPLWIGFILVVNALCCVRSGSCLMLDRPKRFLLLFPLGAGFWWFFEYLNRYVQNWQYIHVRMTPAKYFVLATVAFSTVLPGVL